MATKTLKLALVLLLVVMAAGSVAAVPTGCYSLSTVELYCNNILLYGPDPYFVRGCCADVARSCVCELLGSGRLSDAVRGAISTHCRHVCH